MDMDVAARGGRPIQPTLEQSFLDDFLYPKLVTIARLTQEKVDGG